MQSNNRRLLGILGAIVVPIAIIIGLYTNTGDMFKGYLTFDVTAPAADGTQDFSNAEDYIRTSIGEERFEVDSMELKAGAEGGNFALFFRGEAPDELDNPLFDNQNDCRESNGFESGNLEDQYDTLIALLADRTDPDEIANFLAIKNFYETITSDNRSALIEGNLGLDLTSGDAAVTPFISYEDIQKVILINHFAYQTGCSASIDSIPAYWHDVDGTPTLVSTNDLVKLFETRYETQEHIVTNSNLSSTASLNNLTSNKNIIASSLDLSGQIEPTIFLGNSDDQTNFDAISTDLNPAGRGAATDALDFTQGETQDDILAAVNTEISEYRDAIEELTDYVDSDLVQGSELKGGTKLTNNIAATADLATDPAPQLTQAITAVEDSETANILTDGANVAIEAILGFSLATPGITEANTTAYVGQLAIRYGTLHDDEVAAPPAPPVSDPQRLALGIDAGAALAAVTEAKAAVINGDDATFTTLATAQIEYLAILENQNEIVDGLTPILDTGKEQLNSLAEIIKFTLTAKEQTFTARAAGAVFTQKAEAQRAAVSGEATTKRNTVADNILGGGGATFNTHIDNTTNIPGELGHPNIQAVDADAMDSIKASLEEYVGLLDALLVASEDGAPERHAESLIARTYQEINRVKEGIKLRLHQDFQIVNSEPSLAIDFRAGSEINGAFPEQLVIKSDIKDGIVDLALIQVESTNDLIPAVPLDTNFIKSLSNLTPGILGTSGSNAVSAGGSTQALSIGANLVTKYHTEIQDHNFSSTINLAELNADARNFRGNVNTDLRINPNQPQVLLVRVASDQTDDFEHNYIENSKNKHLEQKVFIYIFRDNIDTTEALVDASVTDGDKDNYTPNENIIITTIPQQPQQGDLTLPARDVTEAYQYGLKPSDNGKTCAVTDDDNELTILGAVVTINENGSITTTNPVPGGLEPGEYNICISIYDDQFENTNTTITIIEADEDADADADGALENQETSIDSQAVTINPKNYSIQLTGTNLTTTASDYKIVTGEAGSLVVHATANSATLTTDGDLTLIFNSKSNHLLPCLENSSCPPYKLAYKNELTGVILNVNKLAISSPLNASVINEENPTVEFECLAGISTLYEVTVTNQATGESNSYQKACTGDSASINNIDSLEKSTGYNVDVSMIVDGQEIINQYTSINFSTSNTYLLSASQVALLPFSCGRTYPDYKNQDGHTIAGDKNVVITGATTACNTTNPFPNATIGANYKIKIEGTTNDQAVPLSVINNGYSANSLVIPTATEQTTKHIVVLIPTSNGYQEVQTASTVLVKTSNSGTDTQTRGGNDTIEDYVDVSIGNTIESGELIDFDINIDEEIDIYFLQVSYAGNQDDRDTRRENKRSMYIYCQDDLTEFLEGRRAQNRMDRYCEDHYQRSLLQGPDSLEVEDFDTSGIEVEGDYDIIIDLIYDANSVSGELAEIDSNTAYADAHGVQLQIGEIVIENAFELENNNYGGHAVGYGTLMGFNPMSPVVQVNTQQCSTVFADLAGRQELCADIMYLYERNLYRGVQMGNNVVSGAYQQAVRAHLFSLVYQLLQTTQNLPPVQVNHGALIGYYSDINQNIVSNPSNQWWLTPLYSLTGYRYIQGDAQYNANPFAPVTQAEAAKLIGMATGLIPQQLAANNPWYADVVAQYIMYGLNINPTAPANMGDIILLLSRSMQIMENPSLYAANNPYMGQQSYAARGLNQQMYPQGQMYSTAHTQYSGYYPAY